MHEGRSKRDGAKVGSGRYRLGSGERPYQHVFVSQEEQKRLSKAISSYSKTGNLDYDIQKNTINGHKIPKHEQMEAIAKELHKVEKGLYQKFWSDDEVVKKYSYLSADFNHRNDPDYEQEKDWIRDWYAYDDGDQQAINAFSLYLIDKGISPRKYYKSLRPVADDYEKACKEYAKDLLGKYGDIPLIESQSFYTSSYVLSNLLDEKEYDYTLGLMLTADSGDEEDEAVKFLKSLKKKK